jgi:nucleotide-binding universal stress UspA family protein
MPGAGEPKGEKQKILVPINFSTKSEMALDFALTHSRLANVDIYLFHVFEIIPSNYRDLDRLNEEYLEHMKDMVTQSFDRLTMQGLKLSVDDVYRRVSSGKAPKEILRMAAGISADMIVMGSSSRRDFRSLISSAPCTVVLVRDKDPEFVAK